MHLSPPTLGRSRRGGSGAFAGEFASPRLSPSTLSLHTRLWRRGALSESPGRGRCGRSRAGGERGTGAYSQMAGRDCFSRVCSALSPSRVLRGRLSDFGRKKNQTWKEVARRSPFPAGPAGLAGASSAAGLLHATFARLRVSIYMWSQNVRRLDDSHLPRHLRPAGLSRVGKEVQGLLLLCYLGPHVCCRRTVTAWPASLGWLFGPAGASFALGEWNLSTSTLHGVQAQTVIVTAESCQCSADGRSLHVPVSATSSAVAAVLNPG